MKERLLLLCYMGVLVFYKAEQEWPFKFTLHPLGNDQDEFDLRQLDKEFDQKTKDLTQADIEEILNIAKKHFMKIIENHYNLLQSLHELTTSNPSSSQ